MLSTQHIQLGIRIGFGGAIIAGGALAAVAISPLLFVSTPVAALDAYRRFERSPALNDDDWEPNPFDIAVVACDCAISGAKQALDPLGGALDVMKMGAGILIGP